MTDTDFERLIEEAEARPFVGWDVSYDGRIRTTMPWDFADIVDTHARNAATLLDLGTGGGEWLSRLPHRPARTAATEGWAPNVPIARARLEPLGVEVFAVEGAPDNVDQKPPFEGGALPFADASFELIVSRHESYLPAELRRVLPPDGVFLTQQVASGAADDFYRLLNQSPPPVETAWSLEFARRQLEDAGLEVVEEAEGSERTEFADVGAFAWYLKNMPFMYPDFSIAAARETLRELHENGRPIVVGLPLFRLKARPV